MNKKKDLLFSLLILHFIGFPQFSFGQNFDLNIGERTQAQISNVQARQDKYKIIISYDLNEPLTENQKIELNYTSYSGETFQNKISDAFGDVGEFVLPGTGKEIIIFLEGKHGKYILEKSLVRFGVMVIQ
jgi:hypothetical protein